jgi:hypothetical protein
MSDESEDEISPENAELFEHYRNGSIGPDEEVQLFEFLNSLKHKHGKTFKLRPITEQFSYNDFDYKKLASEWFRWRKRQARADGTGIEPRGVSPYTIGEKASEVSKGATKALFDQVQEIGTLLVTQFTKNAADRGEGLKEYVMKCIELREQYGDQIESLRQENDVLKTLCSMFAQAIKPHFKQLAAARMYLDWTTGLMQLQAMGIDLNQQYIDDITNRIEEAMKIRIM